ncbi:DUF2264 domain-containing protein [Sphingobacterium sp. LRF_L2]|uniref:DUF2264 domain-containing protein n=1 Tax=Sphingobacterium sp. LRF_L2 TaxID=3369421 RepID=UPI003F624020
MKILSIALLCFFMFSKGNVNANEKNDRDFWLQEMDKMARPVIRSLAHDSLRILMPQVTSKNVDNKAHRIQVQYVEVLGRVLCGISPWLALEDGSKKERALRTQYREWVLQGMKHALDSNARDFMRFDLGGQQLVDASFIAVAFIRCPWLWDNLDEKTKVNLVNSIRTTRQFKPVFSNWLLFSAMNEAFLARFGYDWDVMRVDYALQQLEQWYVGDGMYMDGQHYAYDYYNSFVIHPFLAGIMDVIEQKTKAYDAMFAKIKKRNIRYAIIQERLIHADGTYPPSGRSIIYRAAAFHHLADMSLKKRLPDELSVGQVRGALTAVLKKTLKHPRTYENGWLTIGLYGEQPGLGDFYNNQGSPYLTSVVFLPLGLSAQDDFWTAEEQPWTAKRLWSGEDGKKDYSIAE